MSKSEQLIESRLQEGLQKVNLSKDSDAGDLDDAVMNIDYIKDMIKRKLPFSVKALDETINSLQIFRKSLDDA